MKQKLLVAVLLLLGITTLNAQKIVLKKGSLEKLKTEKFFNIEYVYDGMSVGKFDKEEDYVAKKVTEYNEKEKGRGDKWKKSWIADRKSRFQPKFEQLLNKYLDGKGVFVGEENKDAKYTMILKTTSTEPGFNIYVSRKPAMIDVILYIVESENHDNVIAEIVSKGNTGSGLGTNDFDSGARIQEAYAKCGKELGKWLTKKAYK